LVGTLVAAAITPPFTIGWNRLLNGPTAEKIAAPTRDLLRGRPVGLGATGCALERGGLRMTVGDGDRGYGRCCVEFGNKVPIEANDVALIDLVVGRAVVQLDVTLESGLNELTLHRGPLAAGERILRVPLSGIRAERLCLATAGLVEDPHVITVWEATVTSPAPVPSS
jgi:hypothetical protein